MTELNFDPNTLFEAYRNSLAPMLRAQQEGLKTLDRFAHYQYALAGDYMEWNLATAKAVLGAKNPAELTAKQAELGTKLSDQLRGRLQEFSTLTTEAQGTMTRLFDDATSKFAEATKKAA